MQNCLGAKGILGITGGSLQIGASIFGKIEATVNQQSETILKRLQSGRKPLLLILDEAQTLGMKDEFPAGKSGTVRHVLNAIHNGNLGKPVILLAAGLGPTTEAFGSLGISRFAKRCRVELGALDKKAECAVLHDWLTEDGKATGDTTAWIDAITKETHGWPQHILSYVELALDQLNANKRTMTAEGLNAVLEAGRAGRTAYYKQRAEDFVEEHRQSFAKVLVDVPLGESTTRSAILSHLMQEYGADEAKRLFRRAEEKGIIVEMNGRYAVPIPTMHDWLVSNYARI